MTTRMTRIAAMTPVPAAPTMLENSEPVNGINYDIITMPAGGANGMVNVGANSGYIGTAVIPATIAVTGGSNTGTYDVVGIANNAFRDCTGLTELDLRGATKLETIGSGAFYNCTNLSGKLTLPGNLETIGSYAFQNCTDLTELDMSGAAKLTTIGSGAFYGCRNLSGKLTLPGSLQTIGDNAFNGYSNLSGTLTLPYSLRTIGNFAFSGCRNLSGKLTLPGFLLTIGDRAFQNCSGFTELDMRGATNLTTIGGYAFFGCTNLSGTLTLPGNLETIGEHAFNGCFLLRELDMSGATKLTTIGSFAFYNCSNLASADLSKVPVTSLADSIFQDCFSLAAVTLPPTLTSIGNNAFNSCNALRELVFLGPTLSSLGNEVFYFTSSKSVTVKYPAGGTGYNEAAFNAALGSGSGNVTWSLQPVYPVASNGGGSGGGSGGSSGGGSGGAYTQKGVLRWLTRSEIDALIASAKGNRLGYILVRRDGGIGIRNADALYLARQGYSLMADTAENAVELRVMIPEPGKAAGDLLLSGAVKGVVVDTVRTRFEKFFKNKVRVIHFEQQADWSQPVEIAAKLDLTGMDAKNLYFYSYDKAANIYKRIENPAYYIDAKGYLHFTTRLAGDIIITDAPLERK